MSEIKKATPEATFDVLKEKVALQLLISDEVRDIAGPYRSNIDFMTKLLMSYHIIDPKAVLGAQHMVDFFKNLHVGPREFSILRDHTHVDLFNMVLLARAVQLGLMSMGEITDRFWKTHENDYKSKPFDFEEIEKQIKIKIPNLGLKKI